MGQTCLPKNTIRAAIRELISTMGNGEYVSSAIENNTEGEDMTTLLMPARLKKILK
jgi:hypothetical protein